MNQEDSFVAQSEKESRSVSESLQAVLTDKERQILDIWPRFEDGEPVWFGDKVDGLFSGVNNFDIYEGTTNLYDVDVNHILNFGERFKRPVQSVLDADGVEIKIGEILRGVGRSQHLFKVIDPHHVDPELAEAFSVRCIDLDDSEECHCRPELLIHTRPDSWELWERDLRRGETCEEACDELVRRAKALAGIEVTI